MSLAASRVRVRMYRVGFGDCLLVRFPGPRHLLVDCGSAAPDARSRLERVAEDVTRECEGRLDLVIASHRHRDHVSGFGAQATLFNRMEVGEVWLPWTEDPRQADAAAIHRRQEALARLAARLAPRPLAALARLSDTDEAAMDVLLGGFAGRPRRRFLAAEAGELRCRTIPGLHVDVAGPSRSEALLARLEVECACAELSLRRRPDRTSPFAPALHLPRRRGRTLFARELRDLPLLGHEEAEEGDPVENVCYWLDRTVNSTSLVLLLRYGRASLLLPGDAQGDAWLPFLERARDDELRRPVVYKVAHHGSHNGTPPRLLEALGRGRSLLSSGPSPWPAIPRRPLLRDLAARGPLARTDRPSRLPGLRSTELYVEAEVAV